LASNDQPPRRGFTIFMTGLSGAGKSTISQRIVEVVDRDFKRPVTVLDGDVVREMLSSGLTFSKADRELNLRRIGFVAGEVTKHGGICVCAVIAPYASARAEARNRIAPLGGFYEVYVSTPLAVCEDRDNKGLYARARRGEIRGFTGIDDPYEPPKSPDLAIDSSRMSLDDEVQKILALPRRDKLL
jgi:sulfate adenylyltransferase